MQLPLDVPHMLFTSISPFLSSINFYFFSFLTTYDLVILTDHLSGVCTLIESTDIMLPSVYQMDILRVQMDV